MTFGVLQQMLNLMTVTWTKIKTFKIQDGGRLPSSKSFFDITQQLIVRFQQMFAIWSRIACRKRSCDINCKFRKSKMADGRYFEIVNAPHINKKLSDFDDICCTEANSDKDDSHFMISTKFCYFKKCVLATTRHRIILLWSNFV